MNQESCLNFFSTGDQVLESDIYRDDSLTLQIKREQFRKKLRNQEVQEWLQKQRRIAAGWFSIQCSTDIFDHFRWILQSSDLDGLIKMKRIYNREQDPYFKEKIQTILSERLLDRDGVPFVILSEVVSLLERSSTAHMPYAEKLILFKSLFDIFEERKHLFLYTGYLKLINKMLDEDNRLVNEMREKSDLFVKLLGPNLEFYSLNEINEVGTLVGKIFKEGLQYYIRDQDAQITRLFQKACQTKNGSYSVRQANIILNLVFILRIASDGRLIVNTARNDILKAYEVIDQLDQQLIPRRFYEALLLCVELSSGSSREVLVDCLMKIIQKMTIEDQLNCLKQYINTIREERCQVYDTLYSFELSPSYWKSANYIFRYIQANYPQFNLLTSIRNLHQYIARRPRYCMIEFNREKIYRAKILLSRFLLIQNI